MNRHCANSYSESIQKSEILSEDWITFLLEDQNHLAGYAQLIKFRNKSCLSASQPMELHRFYIESNWQGQGAAQLLMDAVLLKVASLHCDCLWLGVWEKNPRAQSFYKKFGFEIAGSHVFTLGNDQQRDLIMARYFE